MAAKKSERVTGAHKCLSHRVAYTFIYLFLFLRFKRDIRQSCLHVFFIHLFTSPRHYCSTMAIKPRAQVEDAAERAMVWLVFFFDCGNE